MSIQSSSALERAAVIIDSFTGKADLVAILAQLQQQLGFIPPQSVALIAEITELERPAIYRAIELSPSFTLTPPGKHLLYICSADNCCSKGGTALAETAKRVLGVDDYACDASKTIRYEPFRCLGNCLNGPNIAIDNIVQGPVTPQALEALLHNLIHGS